MLSIHLYSLENEKQMKVYIRPTRSEQIWIDQKERLLLQFKNLSDKDLEFEPGRKHEMIERIAEKLGKPEEEMKIIVETI